jgi:alkylhydroperoxidase family enzyme
MRLGVDETGVTALVGLADHVSGLNKVAFGLLLENDAGDEEPLLPYPNAPEVEAEVRILLEEIGRTESRRLGRPGVPKIWRLLSRNRHYLEATWKKHRVLLDGEDFEPVARLAVGLGVSTTNGCRYFIRYFRDALWGAGWDADKILEIIGVVDHYNSFNTLATGMQIESDIRPD